MLDKLKKAHSEMNVNEEVSVSFDVAEISILIALVEGNNLYEKVLTNYMFKTFDKN
jgi:hypothetical protein